MKERASRKIFYVNKKSRFFPVCIITIKGLLVFFVAGLLFSCISNGESEVKSKPENIDYNQYNIKIKYLDLDRSGTYVVCGEYTSSSTGGRLLNGLYAEKIEKEGGLTVLLFPTFVSIGKDPTGRRVFAFKGDLKLKSYHQYKKITVKMLSAEKSIEIEKTF